MEDYCDWIGMVTKLAQITWLAQDPAEACWEIKTSLNVNCHQEEEDRGGRESTNGRDWEEECLPSLILMPADPSSTHNVCVILKLSLLFHLFLFIIVDISLLLHLWDRSLLLPDEATICFD